MSVYPLGELELSYPLNMVLTIVSAEFLEREVLRPFSKTETFTPGSGLGLGLAQRMIELLGGKLAIASEKNKGTIVHIEVPIHLFNEDNESDQEELEDRGENDRPLRDRNEPTAECDETTSGGIIRPSDHSAGARYHLESEITMTRQDGIYLVGFDTSAGIKRVGRSVLRQLRMNSCRVVPEIQYASLIVAPASVKTESLTKLATKAKEGVEIILIKPRQSILKTEPPRKESSSNPDGTTSTSEISITDGEDEGDDWDGISVRYVYRPIRPSVIAEIMRPTKLHRTYEPSTHGEQPNLESAQKSPMVNSEGSYFTSQPQRTYPSQPTVYPIPGHTPIERSRDKPGFSRMNTGISVERTTEGQTEPPTPGTVFTETDINDPSCGDENILASPTRAAYLSSSPNSPKLGEMRIVPPLLKMDKTLDPNRKHSTSQSTGIDDLEVIGSRGSQGDIEDVIATIDRVRLDDSSIPTFSDSSKTSDMERSDSKSGSEYQSGISLESDSSQAGAEDSQPLSTKDKGPLRGECI